jgi:hypothetical protein
MAARFGGRVEFSSMKRPDDDTTSTDDGVPADLDSLKSQLEQLLGPKDGQDPEATETDKP